MEFQSSQNDFSSNKTQENYRPEIVDELKEEQFLPVIEEAYGFKQYKEYVDKILENLEIYCTDCGGD